MVKRAQSNIKTYVLGGANANSVNPFRQKLLFILIFILISLVPLVMYIPNLTYADEDFAEDIVASVDDVEYIDANGAEETANNVTEITDSTATPNADENLGGDIVALADGVEYIDANGVKKTANNVTEITDSTTALNDGWYFVSGNVSHTGRITVSATSGAHLILEDGCNYTVTGGIGVAGGNAFTIYGQSAGTGVLTATVSASGILAAGIGGTGVAGSSGTITINGGVINSFATFYGCSAIGGGSGGTVCGDIIINAGTITSDGIGSFADAASVSITINGGTIISNGNDKTAGIGSAPGTNSVSITISGGTITAKGGQGAAGIGCGWGTSGTASINISGGTITATGEDYYNGDASDIGWGDSSHSNPSTFNFTITGGSVNGTRGRVLPTTNGVYLTTLTLTGVPSGTKIATASYDSVDYDVNGVTTRDEVSGDSKVYFYLPVDTYAQNSIKVTKSGGLVYKNSTSISVDNSGASAGTLSSLSLSGNVSILGNPVEGEVLSADESALVPSDYSDLSYVWKRSGSSVTIGTGSTYTLTADDIGHTITVSVSTSSYLGTVISNPTGEVVPVPVYTYSVLEPFGTFTGSGALSARVDADRDKFFRLTRAGIEIPKSDYTITEGSTIITLNEAYLKTYKNGTYFFKAEYSDGASEEIRLTVNVQVTDRGTNAGTTTPSTGDSTVLPILWLVTVLSGVAIVILGVLILRKEKSYKHSA